LLEDQMPMGTLVPPRRSITSETMRSLYFMMNLSMFDLKYLATTQYKIFYSKKIAIFIL